VYCCPNSKELLRQSAQRKHTISDESQGLQPLRLDSQGHFIGAPLELDIHELLPMEAISDDMECNPEFQNQYSIDLEKLRQDLSLATSKNRMHK
jgi:hypothetical protein